MAKTRDVDPAAPASVDVDTDQLPAVQYLILEVLAARWRTGEYGWTFPARLQRHLDALATLGLIGWKKPEPTLRLAWLTDAGRAAALSAEYVPPLPQPVLVAEYPDEAYRYEPLDVPLRLTRTGPGSRPSIVEHVEAVIRGRTTPHEDTNANRLARGIATAVLSRLGAGYSIATGQAWIALVPLGEEPAASDAAL